MVFNKKILIQNYRILISKKNINNILTREIKVIYESHFQFMFNIINS